MSHITIDTNIFEHMFNPNFNHRGHIDILLTYFQKQSFALCVDKKGRINGEYSNQLVPYLKLQDDTGVHLPLLRYWFLYRPQIEIEVHHDDPCMRQIKAVMAVGEGVDKVFVYVAFIGDTQLVTNDDAHIGLHRDELLRRTVNLRGASADIFTSLAASAHFVV